MNVQKVPANQWTDRMRLMKEAPKRSARATALNNWNWRFRSIQRSRMELRFARSAQCLASKRFVNAQGVDQGTCVHFGNCDIGCDVDAKNTLDRNYIAWAEKNMREVRELHLVTNVEPSRGGYQVSYDQIADGTRTPGSQTARIVIVAAGSLGSTELFLRCREINKSLPNVSPFLGHNWSSNGDFLTPAFYASRELNPSVGPTIACAIDFLDRSQSGQSFWIQDGGFPNVLNNFITEFDSGTFKNLETKLLIDSIRHMLTGTEPFKNVMPWFAQGVDAANGTLSLQHSAVYR